MALQQKVFTLLKEKLGLRNKDEGILLKGSSQGFILKVLGLVVAFGLQVLLARILGVEAYGDYIYVLTWANLIGLFTKLGFDRAAKKFLPSYSARGENDYFGAYVGYSIRVIFYISLVIFVGSFVFFSASPSLSTALRFTFIAGFLLVVINTQLGLISSFLEAVREIVKSIIPLYFIRPILIAAAVLAFYWAGRPLGAPEAMWMNVAATFVSTLVVWAWFKSFIPAYDKKAGIDAEVKKKWRSTAYSLLLVSGTMIILMETDTIMLGLLGTTTSAGIYQTAAKIGELSMFGFNSIEIVIAPTIAGFYALNKFNEIQNILRKGVLLMLIFTLPVFMILWFFGHLFLGLYGNEFLAGNTALKILLTSQLVNMATGSALNLMIMTRYERPALYILSGSVVLNIILNTLLIPLLDMEGAALATGITTVIWNLAMYLFVKLKMKMDPSLLSLFKSRTGNS